MATINEEIVTGRKFRKLIDEVNKIWQRISFWTKASDVEFNDGSNAETKMGAISGITSDLNGESENIAASIKAVNQLNDNLKGIEFITDTTGKITGYKTKVGADTVFPFSSGLVIKGTLYTDVRQCTDWSKQVYEWKNRSATPFTISIQNGQTNIAVSGDNGVIAGWTAMDFIRSRLIIDSVSIDY